mmetsp:Transcript_12990/g.28082  ORF Transcript_12990/g.28082 Transcript_12990/m.28082 type:complete len:699 (-) Transcript_12990:27-2123(-)
MRIATEKDAMSRKAVASKATSALDRLSGQDPSHSRKQAFFIVAILSVSAGILLHKYEEVAEFLSGHEADVETKPDEPAQSSSRGYGFLGGLFGGDDNSYDDDGTSIDDDDVVPSGGGVRGFLSNLGGGPKSSSQNSGKSATEMLQDIVAARKEFDDYLRADYGDFVSTVFNKTSITTAFTRPSSLSDTRLKRRMKIKMIEGQLGIKGRGRGGQPTFTWVTGGHSAGAGHGNLLNQSYTVAIDRAAKIVFGAAGIDFRANARAMGGTTSAPEIALCGEAIFGQDVDVLWWDYGMTDGRDNSKYFLWANRAGSHPTFPTLMAYNDRKGEIHVQLEQAGQAAYQLSRIAALRSQFPDSDTHPDADSLPRAVAWYMCSGHHENDMPCLAHKWATDPCVKPRFQTSWHNGWKDHMLIGYASATLLANLLEEAAKEMIQRESDEDAGQSISQEYLQVLNAQEEADRKLFFNSTIPTDRGDSAKIDDGVWRSFLRGHPVCHSARLPSDARFLGLVTGSRIKSTHIEYGYHVGYEIGYPSEQAMPAADPDNAATPPVLTVMTPRQTCELPLENDFKDAFIVRREDGWMTDIYPNDAEADALTQVYSDNEKEKKGYIMMCTLGCDWGKCPQGYCYMDEVKGGNLTIAIDGTEVKDAVPVNPDCYVLKSASGYSFGPGTKDGRRGQYEMKFKVDKPGGKLQVSSVIVV